MDTNEKKPGALERTGGQNRVPDIIRTPDEYQQSVQRWQREHFHVLSPVSNFSGMPDHFGLIASLVSINNNPEGGEVYQDRLFCKEDEVAIAKNGLAKIAQAGGMTIKTERMDDRSILNFWEVRATLRFIGLDGTPQEIDATAEYDLRDGAPRVLKMLEAAKRYNRDATAQITGARQYGLRGAEARAINAAIRQFGIRQKYHKSELLKQFVIVRVVFLPDRNNSAQMAQVTERALAGSTSLFPQGQAKRLPNPEVIDVIGAVPDGVAHGPGAPATKVAPVDPGRRVAKVDHDFESGADDIVFEDGETLTAATPAVAKAANDAVKNKALVRVSLDAAGLVAQVVLVDSPEGAPKL